MEPKQSCRNIIRHSIKPNWIWTHQKFRNNPDQQRNKEREQRKEILFREQTINRVELIRIKCFPNDDPKHIPKSKDQKKLSPSLVGIQECYVGILIEFGHDIPAFFLSKLQVLLAHLSSFHFIFQNRQNCILQSVNITRGDQNC